MMSFSHASARPSAQPAPAARDHCQPAATSPPRPGSSRCQQPQRAGATARPRSTSSGNASARSASSLRRQIAASPFTLGDLVQSAYAKNVELDQNEKRSLRTTLLQRHLWTRLQDTFFAPEADPDRLAATPLEETRYVVHSNSLALTDEGADASAAAMEDEHAVQMHGGAHSSAFRRTSSEGTEMEDTRYEEDEGVCVPFAEQQHRHQHHATYASHSMVAAPSSVISWT